MNSEEVVDIAVVGAGAAGLMSAIFAARTSPSTKILLFDSRQKIGAKILISGGTRCNVTNEIVKPTDYEGGPKHFVQHVLEAFTPAQTIRFFEEIGVKLVLEPTGKYFPTTHSGRTVLEALLKEIKRRNVVLKTGVKIDSIQKKDDLFYLENLAAAGRVILATGGLSLPETGSDGTGLRIAELFGHTVVPTAPALTPLTTEDKDWQALSGVSVKVKLSYFENGRKKAQTEGQMLFTHFGFSGPAALDLSRHVATAIAAKKTFSVEANFLPGGARQKGALPKRLWQLLQSRIKNEAQLFRYPLEVSGVYGYKKAEVTCGGIHLKEVKVQSMESRLVPGLYFAGEILDVDGRIGGFNFQWAWSSGAVAGCAAAASLSR